MCHLVFLRRISKGRKQIRRDLLFELFAFEILVLTINHDQECLFKSAPRAAASSHRHIRGCGHAGCARIASARRIRMGVWRMLAASVSAMLKITPLLNTSRPVELALEAISASAG